MGWSGMLRTMRKPDLLEMRPKLASQKRSTAWSAWSSVRSAQRPENIHLSEEPWESAQGLIQQSLWDAVKI